MESTQHDLPPGSTASRKQVGWALAVTAAYIVILGWFFVFRLCCLYLPTLIFDEPWAPEPIKGDWMKLVNGMDKLPYVRFMAALTGLGNHGLLLLFGLQWMVPFFSTFFPRYVRLGAFGLILVNVQFEVLDFMKGKEITGETFQSGGMTPFRLLNSIALGVMMKVNLPICKAVEEIFIFWSDFVGSCARQVFHFPAWRPTRAKKE